VALMARDKKAIDGLTFVLDGAHGVEPVSGVAVETVTRVLEDMP
jgi:5-deoxy-5-amino-3-dehydroquinate synthase